MSEIEKSLRIRQMAPADVATGMRFKTLAGWNQVERDWHRFLALSPDGCFVAEIGDEAAGTVVTVTFSGVCGWVAMVLVPPARRRQGIGTAMLRHGIAHLQDSGVDTIKLDATPMGRQVYVPLGFRDEYGLERREGVAQACLWTGVRAMRESDLEEVIEFDTPRFGVCREGLLRHLYRDSGGLCGLYPGTDSAIEGYVMARPGSNAFQIGPLVAAHERAGRSLFCWALDRLAGKPVFFDVPLENPHGTGLAGEFGFSVQRGFTRMYLGAKPYGGFPRRVYATSGPEKG
ncbi:MAG: GNAT family N-acetyltransferase [Gemmatimonadota bacterium]|nr:GNAT family N-acetyltransferase [Gemmatimonadota bacterium]